MSARYAYSLDRVTFVGEFQSRSVALQAAMAAAQVLADPPTEVYVGLKVTGDPQTTGHAQSVLRSMSDRARTATDSAGQYLRKVGEQEEAELDEMLSKALTNWLTKHNLMPTFFNIESISEHSVRSQTRVVSQSEQNEVTEIGTSEFPFGR
ncbi:MAG TPA: hypothetical protein VHS31_16285 [Tepidisphaeraceae bacterium]|jgi:hypothetical protein|nr:hypothetical protein [Tepidisphaeraceae bacterium]